MRIPDSHMLTKIAIPLIRAKFFFWLALFLFSCHPEQEGSSLPSLRLRTLGVDSIPQPLRNPMTEKGVALGKRLFFEKRLSSNGKVSCGSCHLPQLAFTDGFSQSTSGVAGRKAERNTPTLTNVAFVENGLFWDGGARDLESLSFGPLSHPDEMAGDLQATVAFLNSDANYRHDFKDAFGVDTVNSALLVRALAQYQRSLISMHSKYDSVLSEKVKFTKIEAEGWRIFASDCASCHTPGLFTDDQFHNIGLDSLYPSDYEALALGRFRVTLDSPDLGKYRTPTLRNVALTAPYMHDGRFASLQETLNHPRNKNLTVKNGLSNQEKNALIAFLHTLTDSVFIRKHSAE